LLLENDSAPPAFQPGAAKANTKMRTTQARVRGEKTALTAAQVVEEIIAAHKEKNCDRAVELLREHGKAGKPVPEKGGLASLLLAVDAADRV
jgi:hypothetical protein